MNQKIILITGASSGIGKSTAEQLLRDGYVVYAAARRVEQMADLQKLGAHLLPMDVTDEAAIKSGVQKIISEQGRIDVLINNAGFGMYGSVEETTLKDARYQLDVNLFGVASLTQAVLPHMRGQKSGTIVNISSMGGKIYTPLGAWYHATKHAIEGWSDCLRIEVKQFGINVVIIEPGIIQTSFGDVLVSPMLQRSGEGPYKNIAHSVARALKKSADNHEGSPPELIAKTISQALKAKNPKTRYLVGKMAKPLVFIRKWFGDRLFDKAMMSQVK